MHDNEQRRSWKRISWVVFGSMIGIAVIILISALYMSNFLIDMWWFDSVGYSLYFWLRLLYRYAVFTIVTIVFFSIFFLNFRLATRYLRKTTTPSESKFRLGRLGRSLKTGSRFVYIPLSMFLSIIVAIPLFQHWEEFIFYIFGPSSGIPDTVFGRDISYYLFSYPVYTLVQSRVFIALLILFVGLAILYGLEHYTRVKEKKGFRRLAAWHLAVMAGLITLAAIWNFSLQRYGLVYVTKHEPLFFGPGYLEVKYELVLIWAQMLLLAGIGILAMVAVIRRRGFVIGGILVACFLLVVGLRHVDFVGKEIARYWVDPDRLVREKPYIDKNVRATLHGYGLDRVEVRDFRPGLLSAGIDAPSVGKVLRNVPLWEEGELKAVYDELQVLRTYYDFPDIGVGRYTVERDYQQVFLAARELNYDLLPGTARTWVNKHLDYTHGYGLVMSPASQTGADPFVWFVHGIPLESQFGILTNRPEIYFGVGQFNQFVIAPNESGEFDYAREDQFVTSHYGGHGGVKLSSLPTRAVFAYHFKDKNILVSTLLTDESRILFRRNVLERIRTLAPYLLPDGKIYPVITPDGLYWIQDAYTISDRYPASQPMDFQGHHFNYIRNSVKIVVDAYDGSVDFYIFDPKDPIVRAYNRIYPGLFKDRDEMPDALKKHVRYPKDFFEIQMSMYRKYHQTDPVTFFEQEDVWEFAKTLQGKNSLRVQPYYLTLDLFEPGTLEFLIMQPMTPLGVDNLRALAVGGCDGENYGKIIIYSFPKGEVVYSPVQMAAIINAEPTIAEQFNLWDMSGSRIQRGKMVILPVNNTVIYIQPIFLEAKTRRTIPELQRVVMTEGHVAVMDKSLEAAYAGLRARAKEMEQRAQSRFPASEQDKKQDGDK